MYVRSLGVEALVPVLTVRYIARRLQERWKTTSAHNWNFQKQKWTLNEARAFLGSFNGPRDPTAADSGLLAPTLLDRNIQNVAQLSAALEVIELLAQSLLLDDRVRSPAHRFSGKAFHAFLTSMQVQTVSEARTEGLEGRLGRRGRKEVN